MKHRWLRSSRVCWQIQLMADFAVEVNNSYSPCFGRGTTVWTPQRTPVMISAMNFGPGLNPYSLTATASLVVLPETTDAFSMPSCGSCAQELPAWSSSRLWTLEQCFCEISQTCQGQLLDQAGKTVYWLPRFWMDYDRCQSYQGSPAWHGSSRRDRGCREDQRSYKHQASRSGRCTWYAC